MVVEAQLRQCKIVKHDVGLDAALRKLGKAIAEREAGQQARLPAFREVLPTVGKAAGFREPPPGPA